jgi:hypothetical protein
MAPVLCILTWKESIRFEENNKKKKKKKKRIRK